jgi:microcystin-dependent protein
MPWDGSGNFTRYYGATGWVDDKNAAIKILASRHDTHDTDLASGVNACLTRDNQAKPTADFKPNASATYDIGTGAVLWRNLFLSGNLSYGGTTTAGGTISPSQITANQNDYNPTSLSTATVLRLNSDARRNVTGLQGGAANRLLTIFNVGTFPIVFTYEDAGSSAANRFSFGMTLGGGQCMVIVYDGTSSRWRPASLPDPLGMIKDFAGSTLPAGYLGCDGTAVSRTTYASLFNEVGTTWGVGDGSTTFNLPDFRRRGAVGSGGSGTGTLGNAVGNTGGAETHPLVTGELASHSHANTSGGSFLDNSAAGVGWLQGAGTVGVSITTNTTNTGSGTAHNNMPPSGVTFKMIKYA